MTDCARCFYCLVVPTHKTAPEASSWRISAVDERNSLCVTLWFRVPDFGVPVLVGGDKPSR